MTNDVTIYFSVDNSIKNIERYNIYVRTFKNIYDYTNVGSIFNNMIIIPEHFKPIKETKFIVTTGNCKDNMFVGLLNDNRTYFISPI